MKRNRESNFWALRNHKTEAIVKVSGVWHFDRWLYADMMIFAIPGDMRQRFGLNGLISTPSNEEVLAALAGTDYEIVEVTPELATLIRKGFIWTPTLRYKNGVYYTGMSREAVDII